MSLKRKSVNLAKIVLFLLVSLTTVWAAGEIDPTFNVAAYQIPGYSSIPPMKAQPDGKLLIAPFEYGVNNGIAFQSISRLNADGTVDASFNAPRLASGTVAAFALQSNGKILLSGNFTIENSPYEEYARLNPDGSLDTTFNVIATPLPREGHRIFVQPDDSFFTGSLYHFDANGVLDPTFQYQPYFAPVSNIAGLPDGKVYVGFEVPMSSGFDFLTRHNADGTRDMSYNSVQPNDNIRKIIVQSDGKLLIAGPFTFVNATQIRGIARLNTDGTIDSSFNPGGAGPNSDVADMALLPDGKILIAGGFDTYNGITRNRFARLNPNGSLDGSFNYTGTVTGVFPTALEVLSSGKIVAGGDVRSVSQLRVSFIMLNSDGSQVPEFFIQKALPQRVRKTTVQADGKIYVAGEFRVINGYDRNSLARLNANGTVDTSFVPIFSGAQLVHQVLVQPDGKVLASMSHGLVLVRLNANGTRDTSFTTPYPSSSAIYDIALQADGKILLVGDSNLLGNPPRFARLNSNGTVDSSFNPTLPNGRIYRVLIQPDGKIIICGEFTQIGAANRGRIARFNTDGTLDETFNPPGGANGNVNDIDLQADGKIVLGGTFNVLNGSWENDKIGRLNPDGSRDTSFAQNHVDIAVQTVKVQPDGKVLIGGLFSIVGGTPRQNLARLNSNGSLDPTFNTSANAFVFDVNVQADGKILVAGDFTKINNVVKLGIARLNNSAPPRKQFDYDGDGKDDVSVFRPSENRWYLFKSSDSTVVEHHFGLPGDVVAPADYDGDAKTDIGIFRPSTGNWWYLSSVDGLHKSVHWGASGDIPRPSNLDADGKADFIFFRPSENNWYRLTSTGASSTINFGLAGDKPVTGDFDGDGKSDVAIFRPSTGDWWWQSSIDNIQRATHWGISTDIPAPADYDGDGKTDFAVYRPSTGVWYIINSSNFSFTVLNFGLAEDKPIPADYDGDGKADIAVFRPSTGVWYLMRSTSGFTALQFGVSTDIPTPNAFVP